MAQYPIPQFIESEGKIISFLTFRQFFIVVGGGAIIFLAYYLIRNLIIFALLALVVGFLTAIIAFVKIDNTSVVTIVLDSISFVFKSKDYTWQKKEGAYPFKVKNAPPRESKDLKNFTGLEGTANRLNDAKKMVELRKKT